MRLPGKSDGIVPEESVMATVPGQIYFAKDANNLPHGRIYFDDEEGNRYMVTSLISQYDSALHEISSYYVNYDTSGVTTQYADGIYKLTFVNGSGSTKDYSLTDIYLNELTWNEGTENGPTATLARYKNGKSYDTITTAAFPSASLDSSGIVTTGSQVFKGNKSFNDLVTIGTGSSSGNSLIVNGNANIAYALNFSNTAHLSYDSIDECLYFTFD